MIRILGLVAILCSPAFADSGLYEVSPATNAYQPAELGETRLHSVGSDSMEGLVELWVERYREYQPGVAIQVLSSGSASAPAALIEGVADMGPMARPMKNPEKTGFLAKYGFEPTQIRTAIAGVGVFVAEDNPINEMTFKQLDAIFSADKRRASGDKPVVWSELGVDGVFGTTEVMPLGKLSSSYTNAYFRQQVLLQSEFHPSVKAVADQKALLEAIANNPGAIAFGRVGILMSGVKQIAIARSEDARAVAPTATTLMSGEYPLARFLNIYIVRAPGEELDIATKDFLRFVLSRQGQSLVNDKGLIPLPTQILKEEIEKIS